MQKPLLQRPTVTGSVVDCITERIVSGQLRGGEQIKQESLAKELGVSRVPVREALLQLEAEGLVEIMTHKGAMVVPMSYTDAIDLFETRELLELFLMEKAVPRATQADYQFIEGELEAYDKALRLGADPATLSRLNWSFHIALLRPSDRPRSIAVLRKLHTSLDRYLGLQIRSAEAKEAAFRDHHLLLDAYVKRDVAGVTALLQRHIDSAKVEVIVKLEAAEV